MAKLNIFKGGLKVGAGFTPMGKFPLMEAHDIVVDEDGTRLDDKLKNVGNSNLVLDTSLTQAGYVADAKAVGDRINETLGDIQSVLERI